MNPKTVPALTAICLLLMVQGSGAQESGAKTAPRADSSSVNAPLTKGNESAADTAEAAEEPVGDTVAVKDTASRRSAAPTAPAGSAPSLPPPDLNGAMEIPGGVIFGTFTKNDGPFLIKGSVIVPSGQTLEFGPGCIVYVGGEYSTITVFGQLIAKGSAREPVVFRSARPNPEPWDWDRIYCRSRARSLFEHCIVRDANYGITVENGSASITSSRFNHNSLYGLVVRNSDAILRECSFTGGHLAGVMCMEGANVYADSLKISGNRVGIAAEDKAFLKLNGGRITGNDVGVAGRRGSSLNMVGTEITRNKTGVAGEEEIPRKALEMVYGNGVNAKTITAKEMETLLKPPEEVKSIILPKSKTAVMTPEGYTAGFAATSEPRESMTSFIGNIEAGLAYFDPISDRHPVYDTLVRQTMYIGEHSDAWYSGIQPEITIFAQGRRGDMDVNLNMGLYGNNWIDSETRMRKESFTLSLNSSDQSIVFGDFYENISSLSISGRKLTGFRYTGDLMPMGRGMKRISYELAAGESEIARDSGDHELDRVEVVDSGFSVRQQLSYVASVTTKPTHYSSISARAVVARDQTDEPLLRDPITDPGVADPVAAQMGVIDGSLLLLGGKLSLTAEVALGAHDTINSLDVDTTFLDDGDIRVDTLRNRHEDFYEIAWYNPQIFSRAIPRVFGLMHPDSNGYAVALGAEGTLRGYDLALTFVELAQDFFSAGNPYMEADKRQVSLTGEKEYSDRMSGLAGYRWEQVGVSRGYERKKKPKADSPEQRHTVEVRSELGFGDKLPVLSLDYYGRVEHGTVYEDTSDALSLGTSNAEEQNNLEFRNGASVELRQRFDWGLDYSVRYRIVHDNDLTEYVDRSNENIEDGLTNELNTRINYRLRRRLRNRSAFRVGYKSEVRDSARTFYYKLSDRISIGIIPRKLTLGLGAGYEGRIERELDSYTGERKTIRYRLLEGEGDLRYSLTPEMSATIEGQYRRVYDEMQGAENYRVKVVRGFVTYLF